MVRQSHRYPLSGPGLVVLFKAPAERDLFESRPPAMRQARETTPTRGLELEKPTDHGSRGAAVCDDDERPARLQLVQSVFDRWHSPGGDLHIRLPATPRNVDAAPPVGVLTRETLTDLVAGQALPAADVSFSQTRLQDQGDAHQRHQEQRRLLCASGVGGEHERRVKALELLRGGIGLSASHVVEGQVPAALEASLNIPCGASIP